ncbi:hypothetical protein SUREIYA_00540 [Serratia phage vB_SmaM-Sureiya]|nr:hypothetical protein SUREIYA_00540 [Serratia phage vB_SmaM-Sureiya]
MHIPEIEINRMRKIISSSLSERFHVNQVTVEQVKPDALHEGHIWESEVYAFEFIINGTDRYITFCTLRLGRTMFTRAKQGICESLAKLIRPHDFGLMATGDYLNRNDVVGKFIECQINLKAHQHLQSYFASHTMITNNEYDVAIGYDITRRHKTTMTFDCVFEILVKEKKDINYTKYSGMMINGSLTVLNDVNGKSVNIRDIFI